MACIRLSALLSIFFILFAALAFAHPAPLDTSSLTGSLPTSGGTGGLPSTGSLPVNSLPLNKLSAIKGATDKLPLSMPKMPAAGIPGAGAVGGTELLGGLTKTFTNEGSLIRLARRRRSLGGAAPSGLKRIPRRVRKVSGGSVLKH